MPCSLVHCLVNIICNLSLCLFSYCGGAGFSLHLAFTKVICPRGSVPVSPKTPPLMAAILAASPAHRRQSFFSFAPAGSLRSLAVHGSVTFISLFWLHFVHALLGSLWKLTFDRWSFDICNFKTQYLYWLFKSFQHLICASLTGFKHFFNMFSTNIFIFMSFVWK
jgi:hypothetical protein